MNANATSIIQDLSAAFVAAYAADTIEGKLAAADTCVAKAREAVREAITAGACQADDLQELVRINEQINNFEQYTTALRETLAEAVSGQK